MTNLAAGDTSVGSTPRSKVLRARGDDSHTWDVLPVPWPCCPARGDDSMHQTASNWAVECSPRWRG